MKNKLLATISVVTLTVALLVGGVAFINSRANEQPKESIVAVIPTETTKETKETIVPTTAKIAEVTVPKQTEIQTTEPTTIKIAEVTQPTQPVTQATQPAEPVTVPTQPVTQATQPTQPVTQSTEFVYVFTPTEPTQPVPMEDREYVTIATKGAYIQLKATQPTTQATEPTTQPTTQATQIAETSEPKQNEIKVVDGITYTYVGYKWFEIPTEGDGMSSERVGIHTELSGIKVGIMD